MTFNEIKSRLEAGEHPEEFASYLGSGVERDAYRAGAWVIKAPGDTDLARFRDVRRKVAEDSGIRCAPTRNVAGWEVQPYLRPHREWSQEHFKAYASSPAMGSPVDTHFGNVGFDIFGRLYAFDW